MCQKEHTRKHRKKTRRRKTLREEMITPSRYEPSNSLCQTPPLPKQKEKKQNIGNAENKEKNTTHTVVPS